MRDNAIQIKTFMLQKGGKSASCRDRMQLNVQKGSFAVADGVTNSYFPSITARELCKYFTEGSFDFSEWTQKLQNEYLPQLATVWYDEVEKKEESMDVCDRYDARQIREERPAGSSTLLGCKLDADKHVLQYHILGDTTLFVIWANGELVNLCTSPTENRNGFKYIHYDNYPCCITNTQASCVEKPVFVSLGNWLEGEVDIRNSYVALMTDGIAQWFQEEYVEKGVEVFECLWNIENQEEFAEFIGKCRKELKIQDDVAVVLLKVPSNWKVENLQVVYRGDLVFWGEEGMEKKTFLPLDKPLLKQNVEERVSKNSLTILELIKSLFSNSKKITWYKNAKQICT